MDDNNSYARDRRFNHYDDYDQREDPVLQSTKNLPTFTEYISRMKKEREKNWKVDMATNQNFIKTQISDSDDYFSQKVKTPPKKWTVTYDNRNYIKSQLSKTVLNQLLDGKKKAKEKVSMLKMPNKTGEFH